MGQGNRGFADRLAGLAPGAAQGPQAARLPPRTGILSARDNRLAELAAGTSVTRIHELVDPALCRMWEGHNRNYQALDETTCGDLIASFKAQGRQEVAAIVRRVSGDPVHAFEVICGARRHWTACWMRANNYPDFKFLIEPRELTDEEAFRLADLENRSRKDLSDYERARDYLRALERYFGGNQRQMAARLEVSPSWLSRYLELAQLPAPVIAAFGAPGAIRISHAATLAPLLRHPRQHELMLQEARIIKAEQGGLALVGRHPIAPAGVIRRLVHAANFRAPAHVMARPGREHVVRAEDGGILAIGAKARRGGGITINLPTAARHDRAQLLLAVEEILAHLGGPARSS
jgi:ParB family chromosome partitioning protein